MINVNKLVLLLRQTKLIPPKDINLMKMIAKKIIKGQKINVMQKQFFNDIATHSHLKLFLMILQLVLMLCFRLVEINRMWRKIPWNYFCLVH